MKLILKTSTLFSIILTSSYLTSPNHAAFIAPRPTTKNNIQVCDPARKTFVNFRIRDTPMPSSLHMFREYAPQLNQDLPQEEQEQLNAQNYQTTLAAFKDILNQVITVDKRENLPRICTQNIELLVNLKSEDSVAICNDVMEEARRSNDQALIDNTEAAIQYIVYFVETFVTEAKLVDDKNKAILGQIIKVVIGRSSLLEEISVEDLPTELERENNLNEFLALNKEKFTPPFLRHLEGECKRIQNAPQNTPESMKLLQIIRMIQLRIVEELGQDLGEGAQVLGQLIGYDDKQERMAVLEAGLTVRGVEFAAELSGMTGEALIGFQKQIGGVDQNLFTIIQEIHDYIQVFIARNTAAAL